MLPGTPAAAGSSVEPDEDLALLERVLAERAVRTVFQPLVELDTGAVVGYEALSRGPEGSSLERPDLLFAAARRYRRLRDLDVACRTAALEAGRGAGLADPYRLFLNAEPEALDGWRPTGSDVPLTVILELTERALVARPAELLQSVSRVRALGWGIALDDVGADPASLALLPLVRPDVIKLDLRLVQQRPSAEIAAVVNAVHAEAERSGTIVLAEGLETEDHVRTARAFGATVGQGWFFGRPAPLPAPLPAFAGKRGLTVIPRADGSADRSPFAVAVQSGRRVRAADKHLLIEVSKQLESHAHAAGESAVVLAAFQEARFFTPATRRRYSDLASSCSFVAALGEGMPPEPLPGVRGAVLDAGDPVRGEWDIAVLGPHFAATLVARDLGDDGPDMQRRFEFVLSHDRELTVRVAAALMSRVWPEPAVVDLPDLDLPAAGQHVVATVPAPRRPSGHLPLPDGLDPVALRASLGVDLLGRALDAATAGVTIADVRAPDQPLVWVNEAFTAMSGYPLVEVLGRNCRFLQGPGSDRRTVAELSAALQEGRQISTRLLNYRRDGVPWWNDLVLSPVCDEHGVLTHYIGVQNDVTARYEAEQRVLHLAYSDTLTGLANRARLSTALHDSVDRVRRTGTAAALLFIDLDDFKLVNDRHGHAAGDELLRHVAGRLRSAVRADDLLARQGGDEFLILLSDLPPAGVAETARRVAGDVLAALSQPFDLGGRRVAVGASVGISVLPGDAASAEEMLGHADVAMYAAKRAGRHQASLYTG